MQPIKKTFELQTRVNFINMICAAQNNLRPTTNFCLSKSFSKAHCTVHHSFEPNFSPLWNLPHNWKMLNCCNANNFFVVQGKLQAMLFLCYINWVKCLSEFESNARLCFYPLRLVLIKNFKVKITRIIPVLRTPVHPGIPLGVFILFSRGKTMPIPSKVNIAEKLTTNKAQNCQNS